MSEQAWPHKWWILAAMSGVMAMIMIDSTVIGVALPAIDEDLGLSQTGGQWVVNSYLLTLAVFAAAAGRLADIYGHARAYYAGTVIFILASTACGFAQGDLWLIIARAVQGIGAALMLPASLALIANAFPITERARALGIYAGIGTIGLGIGPTIGGVVTQYVSWRLIFFINIPIGIAVIVIAFLALPRPLLGKKESIDWTGFVTLTIGLTALVLALMQGGEWGWASIPSIVTWAVAIVSLTAFTVVELRLDQPLVDLRLWRDRVFLGTNIVLFCTQLVIVGVTIFAAVYLQQVLGMSATDAGLGLLAALAFAPVVNPLAGVIADRWGARLPVIIGCALTVAGFVCLGAFATQDNYWILVPGFVVYGIGTPLAINPAVTASLNEVPGEKRGVASGLVQTSRQVGATLGVAILGAIVIGVENMCIDKVFGNLSTPENERNVVEQALTGTGDAADAARQTGDAALTDGVVSAVGDAYQAMFYAAAVVMAIGLVVAIWLVKPPLPRDVAEPAASVEP